MFYSNETEIVIDNPFLLQILQKYKDMGLFGNLLPVIGIGYFDSFVEEFVKTDKKFGIRTPAFFYYGYRSEEYYSSPDVSLFVSDNFSINDVLPIIIDIFEQTKEEYLDDFICGMMIEELQQKEGEVRRGYVKVHWDQVTGWDSGTYELLFDYDLFNGERLFYANDE